MPTASRYLVPASRSRVRRLGGLVASVGVASALVACGAPGATSPAPTQAGSGAYPVTIQHKFGATTIPAPAQRVVTIGDEDIAVALGVTPVGMLRNTSFPSGLAPHQEGKIDLSKTTMIDVPAGAEGEAAAGANVEQVATLRPDLILAINDFGLEADYPKLAQLAPTVGYAEKWGGQPWQEQTLIGAKALGLEERGKQVVAETEAAIRAVREANPGLVGKTVTFSYAYAPGQIVTLKSEQDPAVRLLTDLGMQIPPAVSQLPDIAPGNPGGNLSHENISVMDADIVIMLYATDELRRQVEGLELFQNLKGVQDGRYVVADLPTISALRSPTVLSVPWALQQIGPELTRVAR